MENVHNALVALFKKAEDSGALPGRRQREQLGMVAGFAAAAYATGDSPVRRFTNEPYVLHPIGVASILLDHKSPSSAELAVALLHDVIEDTRFTRDDLAGLFGGAIADGVQAVSNGPYPDGANRKDRKLIDREKLASAGREAQDLKLADGLHNIPSICEHDRDFAAVYMSEKGLMLAAIIDSRISEPHSKLVIAFDRMLADLTVQLEKG